MNTLDLPFVVAPPKRKCERVGSKATGILELPVLGSLQVAEVIDVSDLLSGDERGPVVAAKLAQRISAEQEISLLEAYTLVEQAAVGAELSAEQEALRLEYLSEIAELTQTYIHTGRQRMLASVTALIRHRLERPEWSLEQTKQLGQPLMEALFSFFERERTAADTQSAAPPSEEEIKKSPPGTGNPTA